MKSLIVAVLICCLVSIASAQQYLPFDQAEYEHHRRWAAACLMGTGCLTMLSVVALMAAEGWDDCKDEIERWGKGDVYKQNRDRLVITAVVTFAGAVALGLNASRHDAAADRMLKAKISVSREQTMVGLRIHF